MPEDCALELDFCDCVEPLASDPLDASPAERSLEALEVDPLDVAVRASDSLEAAAEPLDLLTAFGVCLAGLRVREEVVWELPADLCALEPEALALRPGKPCAASSESNAVRVRLPAMSQRLPRRSLRSAALRALTLWEGRLGMVLASVRRAAKRSLTGL